MPIRLSACNSLIHSEGNCTNEATVLFAVSGVAEAGGAGGAGLTVTTRPERDNRMVSGPPFVLCRYQKLNVYAAFAVKAAETVCQIEPLWVVPGLVEITCRLAFPECLIARLNTEFVKLGETLHGPASMSAATINAGPVHFCSGWSMKPMPGV